MLDVMKVFHLKEEEEECHKRMESEFLLIPFTAENDGLYLVH